MKKSLFLSILLLAASIAFSQTYLPMAVENAHWIMFAIGENGPNHHVVTIKGDTTINGVLYKKTWRQEIENPAIYAVDFYPPFYVHPPELIGAMRDDVAARQVFYVQFEPYFGTQNDTCDQFDDWLIYDFSVNIGDTIGGCLQYYPDFPFVAQVISTENLWGQDRKVVDCEGAARLVEGVGTDMGPFWPIFAFPHPAKPSFMYDYCAAEDGYCGLEPVSSTRQHLADWEVNISPNPTSGLLKIDLPNTAKGDLTASIYDVSGKKMLEQSLGSQFEAQQISVHNLPSGVYLLTLQNADGMVALRFAKQ